MSSMPASATPIEASEAALRRDLAAAYRLVAHLGWDDLVATHISVRLPEQNAFLINPFGMLFEEIRPADLLKVDMAGNLLGSSPWRVNKAAYVIHSAVHAARHDAQCVMHLHTPDGIAVSMLKEGLLPLNQTAMLSANDIAFHEFEGIAVELDERDRLVRDLGAKNLMFLRNHGTLALGATIPDAFASMYFLETACTIQVRALGMGRALHPVGDAVINKVAAARRGDGTGIARDLIWPAMLRKLDRLDPGWRG